MSESVLRLPFLPGAVDAHGNAAEAWGGPVALVGVYGFDPGSSSELRQAGHDRVIVEPALYGPFDMPLTFRDRVVIRDLTYEVEGHVRQWRHPRSNRDAGSVVTLRRVSG